MFLFGRNKTPQELVKALKELLTQLERGDKKYDKVKTFHCFYWQQITPKILLKSIYICIFYLSTVKKIRYVCPKMIPENPVIMARY